MKKLFTSLLLLATLSLHAGVLSTTWTTNQTKLILTNQTQISEVILVGGSAATTLSFYDNGTASTTFTNGAYITRSYYTTNIAANYVSNNGITNYITNSVLFTYTNTVAASTNTLPIQASFAVPAGEVVGPVKVDLLFAKGVVAVCPTNGTLIIKYTKIGAALP